MQIHLDEVDLFLIPLKLKPGRYLCRTDIEDYPWAVLTDENVKANITKGPDMTPGLVRVYGPLVEEELP